MNLPPPRYQVIICADRGQAFGGDHVPGGAEAGGPADLRQKPGHVLLGPAGGLAHRLRGNPAERRDAGCHRRGQALRAQHGDRVRDDVGDQVGLGRFGQVVSERDPDAVAGRRDPDHDQARFGNEAEQVRDERQQGRG